jgi:RimJ/RimL family protein N-acetyltransferase/ubiquinone/menaquinone biosynthesis C-methylase UbiE
MNQESFFLHGEGDAWYNRNQTILTTEKIRDNDLVLQLIERQQINPKNVLEVGAANGCRLAVLNGRYGCKVTAVEPSKNAIQAGRAEFPQVRFICGVASAMSELQDEEFDLVITNFVLHWIDRNLLLRSVSEIDRVLADNGHLIIGDFHPNQPCRTKYHHLPNDEVYTYKQHYFSCWRSSRLYQTVCQLIYDHDSRMVCADVHPSHRASLTVLRKDLTAQYRNGDVTTPVEDLGSEEVGSALNSASVGFGSQLRLDGRQVYLRRLQSDDVGDRYLRWLRTTEVNQFLEVRLNPPNIEQLKLQIDRLIKDPCNVMFAIVARETDEHIGNIKIGPINWFHRTSEVGFLIGEPAYWGRGIMTEVLGLVNRYAFDVLNLHKLTAGCYSSNLGSMRAMEKVGYAYEGVRVAQFQCNGKFVDQVLYGCINPASPPGSPT